MNPRVVYIGTPEAEASAFAALTRCDFPQLELLATDDRAAAMEHLWSAEAVIGHHFQFDEALLARAPKLRWIQSLTTGTDAILRMRSLSREIIVTSTRGIHGPQMSELVFLHMLALTRDFPGMIGNQRSRHWDRWPQPLLLGKTVVIVGVGVISEAIAPRCKAFGMTVYGVSGSRRQAPGFDRIFGRGELQEAASLADFLVLVVPLSAETENLVDSRVIAAMKPSSFLINVARGGVLDEGALIEALRARRLAGAALDVFRQTPLPGDSALWNEERLILTPQVGGMSDVYLEQAYPIVRRNLECFLSGRLEEMVNIVSH
jgi:D-2-hydroxyacid dehydrogenase (NADP+)